MNERIRRLALSNNIPIRGYYDESGLTEMEMQRFTEAILAACVDAIKSESMRQLDSEAGIIYANAMVAQFGLQLSRPFLQITVRDNDAT